MAGKPLALPVVPIKLHPSRPQVVWAVGSRVFSHDFSRCVVFSPLPELGAALRALDADATKATTRWLTAGDDKLLTTWREDGEHWQQEEQLSCQKKLTAAMFDRDGRIVFADRFGDVCRWTGCGEPEILSSHFAIVTSMAFTPCGRFLVVGDNHERVRVSCYPQAAEIHSFCFGHEMQITAVSCRENGLLSASADGTLRFWNWEGTEQRRWNLGAPISCMSSHNGHALLGLEAPKAQLVQLNLDGPSSEVEVLFSEAPQAVVMQDGTVLCIDRRGHLRRREPPEGSAWTDVSPGGDFPPALVILSKNAGDAEDEGEGEEQKGPQSSKKKRRE